MGEAGEAEEEGKWREGKRQVKTRGRERGQGRRGRGSDGKEGEG